MGVPRARKKAKIALVPHQYYLVEAGALTAHSLNSKVFSVFMATSWRR
jgi:hypothetical protein